MNYELFIFFILFIIILWYYTKYKNIERFESSSSSSSSSSSAMSGSNSISKNNSKDKKNKNPLVSNTEKDYQCILLGDSILNNRLYVPPGKSVYDFINEKIPTIMYARDGDTVADVYNQLSLIQPIKNTGNMNVLLSVGGNDFLGGRNFLLVSKKYGELLKYIKHKIPDCKLYVLNLYYPPTMTFFYNTIKVWNEYLEQLYSDGVVDGLVDISSMRSSEYFTQKIEPSVDGGEMIADLCIKQMN